MMNIVCEYWMVLIAALAIIGWGVTGIASFTQMPTTQQLAKVEEWLVYAVTLAEKELGSGTGKLKLRMVYDMFLERFPWLAKVVTFNEFTKLVEYALGEAKVLWETNLSVKNIVEAQE